HPLWKEIAAQAQGAGHGGMDYIEDYRLIKCLREGKPTDMNVYDAAALSAVVGLSVQSVAKRSAAVDFPDFTRGRWKTTPPLNIVHMQTRAIDVHRPATSLAGMTRAVVLARGLGSRMRQDDGAARPRPQQGAAPAPR